MNPHIQINHDLCIRCGFCSRICSALVYTQEPQQFPHVETTEHCFFCGHCVGVCPKNAITHSAFSPEKIHPFSYTDFPTPEQLMLLLKARRSNRALSDRSIPQADLERILEAAHTAPTARNTQQVSLTLITDSKQLQAVTGFTINQFLSVGKKLQNPLLKPVLKLFMPEVFKYLPLIERMKNIPAGADPILRGATALILIHTPVKSRFGSEDANLAYQNASLMAECLGISQFYTGFVLSAIKQDKKQNLEKSLGINGQIHAGMALGLPEFRFKNYVDRS